MTTMSDDEIVGERKEGLERIGTIERDLSFPAFHKYKRQVLKITPA